MAGDQERGSREKGRLVKCHVNDRVFRRGTAPGLHNITEVSQTYIFSTTIPFDMQDPPMGLAFMAVTECDLLYFLLDQRSSRRWLRILRPDRSPLGLPPPMLTSKSRADRQFLTCGSLLCRFTLHPSKVYSP